MPADVGLHLGAVVAPVNPVEMAKLVSTAAGGGLRVHTLSEFYFGTRAKDGLVIGYGGIPTRRIGEAMRRLESRFLLLERPVDSGGAPVPVEGAVRPKDQIRMMNYRCDSEARSSRYHHRARTEDIVVLARTWIRARPRIEC